MSVLNRPISLKTRFDLSKYCGGIRGSPLPRIERKIGSRIFRGNKLLDKTVLLYSFNIIGLSKFVADIFRAPPAKQLFKK